jgi:hypothetical protein
LGRNKLHRQPARNGGNRWRIRQLNTIKSCRKPGQSIQRAAIKHMKPRPLRQMLSNGPLAGTARPIDCNNNRLSHAHSLFLNAIIKLWNPVLSDDCQQRFPKIQNQVIKSGHTR